MKFAGTGPITIEEVKSMLIKNPTWNLSEQSLQLLASYLNELQESVSKLGQARENNFPAQLDLIFLHITRSLEKSLQSISSGHKKLAKLGLSVNQNLPHEFLFVGPELLAKIQILCSIEVLIEKQLGDIRPAAIGKPPNIRHRLSILIFVLLGTVLRREGNPNLGRKANGPAVRFIDCTLTRMSLPSTPAAIAKSLTRNKEDLSSYAEFFRCGPGGDDIGG